MLYILLLVLGLLVGIGVCFLVLKPRLTVTQAIDQEIECKNQELTIFNDTLTNKNTELLNENSKLMSEKLTLQARTDELSKSIALMEEQANNSSKIIFNKIQESLDHETEKLSLEFQQNKENYKQEYLIVMEDCISEFSDVLAQKTAEFQQVADKLKKLEATAAAATAAAIREEEKKNASAFYKLKVSDLDKEEIDILRRIAPQLRDPEVINKIIWKSYYEKPYTDLMGRIVTSSIGIYKITNENNGMAYIGQSVNLKDRLKSHIKAGLGIDASKNKLYTAMQEEKVDNFTFEIVEYCKREELNEKEKYWIKYWQTDIYGYNMTQGNKEK